MNGKEKMERRALTAREFAKGYGFSEGTLANFRWKRAGPRYYKVGRKVLYLVDDIEDWILRNPCLTTDSVPKNR